MNYNPYLNMNSGLYQQPQQQTLTRSYMTITSEADAVNYPVAPGNSVLFQNVNDPSLFYEKTMGFSSLDRPTFRRMRLVPDMEPDQSAVAPMSNDTPYVTKAEYEELRAAYAKLSDKLEAAIKSINLFTEKEESNE